MVGALSVVWPCIAEWGWSRQRVIGLVRRRAGLPLMSVEIRICLYAAWGSPRPSAWVRVDSPLGGGGRGGVQAAIGIACFVPWVAVAGFQAWPVVMMACRCRRIAAAITDCAWVGFNLLVSRVVRWAYLAA